MSLDSERRHAKYQIIAKLAKVYFYGKSYYDGQRLWWSTFGTPPIFYKIEIKVMQARELVCPHCGKKGILMLKTTISKKKYRYTKTYVYHETRPILEKSSIRTQKWCYLNRTHLEQHVIRQKLRSWVRAQYIELYFYRSLGFGLDNPLCAHKLKGL